MPRARRILLVINRLGRAGAERQAAHLAGGLARSGDRVTIACLDRDYIGDPRLRESGVEVRTLHLESRVRRALALPRLVTMARAADIVHCMTFDATLWGRLAAILARRPVVMTEHSGGREIQLSSRGAERGRWIALHNRLLDRFTFASVACARSQMELLAREGVSRERIVHIPNGVPVDEIERASHDGVSRRELGIPQSAKVVMHVATLKQLKNQVRTLETVAKLRAEIDDVRAVFVGAGPDREMLERRAGELGGDFAHFLGSRDDVPALLALADVAVLPSIVEAMPMSVIEALALGVPLVAHDVGDVGMVIERTGGGIAVAPGDPEAFVAACRQVLTDPVLHERLAARAGASREFDAAVMTERYSRLYGAALTGRVEPAAEILAEAEGAAF